MLENIVFAMSGFCLYPTSVNIRDLVISGYKIIIKKNWCYKTSERVTLPIFPEKNMNFNTDLYKPYVFIAGNHVLKCPMYL